MPALVARPDPIVSPDDVAVMTPPVPTVTSPGEFVSVTSPKPTKRIRPESSNNSPKPAQTIRNNSPEPEKRIVLPPQGEVKKRSPLPITPYKRVGKVGRQRKYEEVGERGENPINELVVYRHVRGKQYPALSKDMKRWYEFFYFTKPQEGEKLFNVNTSYEQHTEAYERGRKWIAAYEGKTTSPTAVEDSRIVDIEARRRVR